MMTSPLIVVDDGSSEECQAIFEKLDGLATVLHHEVTLEKEGLSKLPTPTFKSKGNTEQSSLPMLMVNIRFGISSV